MKTYGGCRCSFTILNLDTIWKRVVSFTPQPLYLRQKSPRYLSDRRLSGPQSRFGRYGEDINILPLPGIEPLPSTS
jgi:hypothetical protein